MEMEIHTGLFTEGGEVKFEAHKGEYVMTAEHYNCLEGIVISREFFDAAVKEFKDKQK